MNLGVAASKGMSSILAALPFFGSVNRSAGSDAENAVRYKGDTDRTNAPRFHLCKKTFEKIKKI